MSGEEEHLVLKAIDEMKKTANDRHLESEKFRVALATKIDHTVDTVNEIKADVKNHTKDIIKVKAEAKTAREIAEGANDKAQSLIVGGAPLYGGTGAEGRPTYSDMVKRHAPGAAVGMGGLGAFSGLLLFIAYLIRWVLTGEALPPQ